MLEKWERAVIAKARTLPLKEKEDVLKIIDILETGGRNVYFVDEEGRYRWQTIQKGSSRIRRDENGRWYFPTSSVPPIVWDGAVTPDCLEDLKRRGEQMLSSKDILSQVPLVNSQGKIVSAMDARIEWWQPPNWTVFHGKLPEGMPKCPIYISSMKNPLLATFAKMWDGKLTLIPLGKENLEQVMSGKAEGILLYEADIFPDCRKMEIRELFRKCYRSVSPDTAHFEEVELFYEPRESILKKMQVPPGEPEMSAFESAFLCGLLRQFHPKKILEVGLAAGGTSAIIMECMRMLGAPYEMHSVDLFAKFYRDARLETGYLAEEAKKVIPGANQKRWLGHMAFHQMAYIGGDIDFVVLDTEHILPGEMLDFLSILPFLKDGAVVLMHDVRMNWHADGTRSDFSDGSYVNNLLLSTVTAKRKFMQRDPDREQIQQGSNIGAFQVNASTREHVTDLFNVLSVTWNKLPPAWEIPAYRQVYSMFYDEQCMWLYDVAVKMNLGIHSMKKA